MARREEAKERRKSGPFTVTDLKRPPARRTGQRPGGFRAEIEENRPTELIAPRFSPPTGGFCRASR